MTQTQYYWESEDDEGIVWACSDDDAINLLKDRANLYVIYKEDDEGNFIIVWEIEK